MKTAVILNDTSYESHHGCETVVNNIKKLLLKNKIKTIDTNPCHLNWLNNKKFLNNMSKSNLIIVNGEGTLHHAQTRAKELVTVGKYVKNKFNKPIVLINSSYQENGPEIAEFMKYFDLNFVRETLSLRDLERHSITTQVVPDMTFYTKYDLSLKNISNLIGLTDSVNIELSTKLFNSCIKNNYSFLPVINNIRWRDGSVIDILRYIKYNISIIIINILRIFQYQLKYKSIRIFYYIEDYEKYIQQIANLKFLVSGRYHSLCFSLKTLTPFFAVKSNLLKFEGILQDIGIGSQRLISENMLEHIEIKQFSQEELSKIKKYIETAPIKIEKMFQDISKLEDSS